MAIEVLNKEDIKVIDDQIDRLENIVKFLADVAGYKIYKLKEESNNEGNFWIMATSSLYPSKSQWDDKPLYKEVTLEGLKELGDYTTFKVGKDTYLIVKAKKKISTKKQSKGSKTK